MKLFGGSSQTPVEIETVIGQDTRFTGKLESEHSIQVDGSIEGDIECKQTVAIGQSGRVAGNIRAAGVAVAGQVEGNILAHEHVHIRSTGQVTGDIETATLVVEEGGRLDGRSTMGRRKEEVLELREKADHRRR